jgi:hypothetical protein
LVSYNYRTLALDQTHPAAAARTHTEELHS